MLNSLFKGFFLPLNSSIYQKFLNHLLNNCYRLEMFRRLWMDLLVLFNLILITGRLGTILLVCMHPLLWVILHHFHPEIYCLLFSHLSTVLISFIELLHKFSYFNQKAFFFLFFFFENYHLFFDNYNGLPPCLEYYNGLCCHNKRVNGVNNRIFII